MPRKGLGKGLDSLIPQFYDEDFDSNSPQSLEDILNDNEDKTPDAQPSKDEASENKNIFEQLEEEASEDDSDAEEAKEEVEDVVEEEPAEETVFEEEPVIEDEEDEKTPSDIQVNEAHVDEVKEIVNKNPRITLWSSRSSAVLRYLRKTEPEFSISKEASSLIEEAISKKYPEIWELFDDF